MEWVNTWTRDYGVQYCEAIKLVYELKLTKYAVSENPFYYPEKGNEAFYISKKEYENMQKLIEEAINKPEEIEYDINLLKKYGEEYVDAGKKANKMNLKQADNSELLRIYLEFREKWVLATTYLASTFNFNETIGSKTEKIIVEKSQKNKNIQDLVAFASAPEQEVGILKLNRELAVIRKSFKKEILDRILDEYKWIPCLDLHHNPWGEKEILKYYDDYEPKEEKAIEEKKIIEEFKISEEEINLIRLNKKLAYVRDLRDQYRRIGIYYIQKLYSEIGRRMGLSLKEMSYTQDAEIRDFLSKGIVPNKERIHDRFNGFLMYTKNGEIVCISGPEIPRIAKEELGFEEKQVQEEVVRGKTAFKGKVKGKVRIVLTSEELKKVKEGDILVAVTTGADYVPAMHKAGAFVTDEGGLTCHAAIVAREMKKPCIVGTKNATKILREGELVEVDCETGTVKKVSE